MKKKLILHTVLSLKHLKNNKTVEDQGEKQTKVLEGHRKQLVKSNEFTEEESIPLDKQKEIFYKLVAERTGKI